MVSDYDRSALEKAIEEDDLDVVDALIQRDALNTDPEDHKKYLRKLLTSAKSENVASRLMQHGADVESRGDGGSTVLMEATTIAAIRVLLSRGANTEDVDEEGRSALRRSVELDDKKDKAFCLIQDANANINSSDSEGRSVLMTAVWKSRTEVLNLLLSRKGIKPKATDKRGRIALHHLAADKDRIYDYNPGARPGEQQAIDQDILTSLLANGNKPDDKDKKGRSALHWAAATGCNGVLQVFLQSGRFDINELESLSKTPLHLAAAEGRSKCVKALISKNAELEPLDDGGWSPLHYACEAPNDVLDCVDQLLRKGAEVNRKTRSGTTPLHLAAGAGNYNIVEALLRRPEIERNARDMFGNTPLLRAASLASTYRRKDIIKLFAPWQQFHTHTDAAKHAAKLWKASIVDFRTKPDHNSQGNGAHTTERHAPPNERRRGPVAERLDPVSVFELLYERDSNDTGPAQNVSPSDLGNGGFRWLHLPANNVLWCQDLFAKYYVEEGTMNVNSFKALERSFNQQQGGDTPQSRYMSSTCQSVLRPWGNEDGGITMADAEGTLARSATFSEFRPIAGREGREQHSPKKLDSPLGRAFTFASTGSSNDDKDGQPFSSMSTDAAAPATSKNPLNDQKKMVTISDRTNTVESLGSTNGDRNPPNIPLALQTNLSDGFISDFYVFLPYLHFEIYEKHEEMNNYCKQFEKAAKTGGSLQLAYEKLNEKDVALFRAHLMSSEHPLHIRRTLDQSFYRHIDTTERDSGQVIHRFQTELMAPKVGKDKSKILMIDQLWMWVIGEKLIVTSFPVRWEQPRNDPLNLMEYVMSIIELGTREPIRSVYELAMIITGRCYGAYDRHGVGSEDPHFLDMYEGWIGAAMDDEVKLFKFFKEDSENASQWLRDPHSLREAKRRWLKRQKKKKKEEAKSTKSEKVKPLTKQKERETTFKVIHMEREGVHSTEETFVENLLDIGWETSLLQEVKDIRDELGMLSLIFERQEQVRRGIEDVINSIITQKSWGEIARQKFARAFQDHTKTIIQPSKDTERMKSQAFGVYDSVRDLLDLKQKHANAIEARYAREQTDGTSRQGKTLTVFTIVTTIFLPISFIAAVFAIDMKNLPGVPHRDSTGKQLLSFGYVAKWTFLPGLLFAAICVVVGLCWEEIWFWIKEMYVKRKRKRNSSNKDTSISSSSMDKGPTQTAKRLRGPPLSKAESTARSVRIQEAYSSVRRSISRRPQPRDEESGASESQTSMGNGKIQ